MPMYVDEDGFMLKGKFEGEELTEVADADPDYLQNLLDNATLEAEERDAIEQALADRFGDNIDDDLEEFPGDIDEYGGDVVEER